MKIDLGVKLGKLALKNPVMVASGTFGYAEEFERFLDLKKLGALVTKTITLRARQGNPVPRTCETPAGMLNSIGLENPGLEKFVQEKLPVLKKYGVPVVVSIASEEDPDEFLILAQRLDACAEVAAIELNISCPNLKKDRLISQDPEETGRLVGKVRSATGKTLIVKLTPNVTDITIVARACEESGADAVAMINTLNAMAIDVKTGRPKIAMVTAGLSGPAVRPVAVRMVWETSRRVKIPIIGMGGITDTESALEFILAGATAISVGTQNFVDPAASTGILKGIEGYLKAEKIARFTDLIGRVKL